MISSHQLDVGDKRTDLSNVFHDSISARERGIRIDLEPEQQKFMQHINYICLMKEKLKQ